MPNIKSAKKRLRTSEEAHGRNVQVRTQVKSARRKLFEALDAGEAETADLAYRAYCGILDNAAKKGVIKKNTATRRKGRAADKVRALASS
jgi:small subunit ribosomal protein S20